MLPLLRLVATLAWLAAAAGPGDLAALKDGQAVGAYRAQAVYLDPAGKPKGARFLHERGAAVDVLFFDSVPQVSLYFRTPPEDERGAPHALEHLLLGKGAAGRRLNTLMQMRMGDYTAGTYSDLTNYQFSSAAGPAEFYELLDAFLGALVRPDFTDEEARREAAHTAVAGSSGTLALEEKGTVYAEMVARMERPDAVRWDELGRLLYGPKHPLALNQGGEPSELWRLSPGDIRAFHERYYHLDGNMALIAALPMGWTAADFLARLDETLRRLEPAGSPRTYPALPPFEPRAERPIRFGRFPSDDAPAPQDVAMAWPPVRTFTLEEELRLGLALDLLGGGEPSYLHRDLVDRKTRLFDSGATGVGMGAAALPASYAHLWLSGLPLTSLTPEILGRLRAAVVDRARWLRELKAGSPELAETAEKTRARALARRREMLRAMDGPPMFGARFSGDGWHRALDARAAQPGFEKPLSEEAALDRLLAELASGANPWTAVVDRAGLLEPPYLSAALPDPALLGRQRRAKEERLAAAASRLASGYGLPPAQALERYQAEAASATAVLDALAARAEKPSFLREPPLELDALRWSEGRLPSGPRLVRTEFDTPFTNLSVAFDLGAVPRPDWELLPLLEAALGGVGVVTASGERLDYAQAAERRMAEIYGAGVGAVAHPRRDRAELVFAAHASSEEEVGRAAAWLESYLLRPNLSEDSRERLVDSLRASIQGWRGVFQADEESWVAGAAAAYEHQDRPLYMHLSSPFTVLRHLNRLRWRLEKPAPAELAVLRATATAALAAADGAERGQAAVLLEGVAGELGEYLRWELSHLPEDSWRRDLRRLATELLEDVGRPEETIARLRALAKRVLVRAGARVHLNGSPRSLDRALPLVDRLIARLPAGRRAPPAKRQGLVAERLNERLPGLERPVHVALVNNGGKTGTVSVWAKGPGYRSRSREDLLDALAFGVLGGGGAHSLFIRTWGAGLAYGNGMSHRAWSGRVSYYADKCPDPAQTLRFVGDVAASTAIDDPFLLEYSLSGAFGDFRGLGDFTGRGSALAYDLEEGNRPELVRAYKARLLALARAPGTLEAVRARFKSALGRVLVGLPGGKVAASPEAGAFLIGPDDLIEKYEAFVKERGEAERVIRLYPRDFWP